MTILSTMIALASEGGIPAGSPLAKLAVPIGIVIFVGPIFMLLRSNLGTRRGYLVMSTTLWGSTFLMALFWTFGAPGTPAFTGPQNLPGQELDEYLPVWIAMAPDSGVVTEEGSPYSVITDYPNGFDTTQTVSDEELRSGIADITSFFGALAEPYIPVAGLDEPVLTEYATADNGRPIIGVTFARTCQLDPDGNLPAGCDEVGAVAAEGSEARGEDQTLFAFFDAGNPAFPSFLMLGATFLLFGLHMVLLGRDETRERAEADQAAEEAVEADERATVSA